MLGTQVLTQVYEDLLTVTSITHTCHSYRLSGCDTFQVMGCDGVGLDLVDRRSSLPAVGSSLSADDS